MRILFAAAEEHPPRYASVEGIFGSGLARLGHDVPGIFYGPAGGRARWGGGEVRLVPRPVRSPLTAVARSIIAEGLALRQAYRTLGPTSCVIVRDDPVMALAALAHRDRLGPLIYQISHLHPEEMLAHARMRIYGPPALNRAKGVVARSLRDLAIRRAAHVLVMTEEAAAALRLAPDRYTVLPEGVAADWSGDVDAAQVRRELEISPSAPVVLYAGTLNRVRRVDVVIAAFAIVVHARPDAVLIIAGSGREKGDEDPLREVARREGLDRSALFLGAVPHRRIASLMDASDIVLSPLPNDPVLRCNSPVKLFEAMQRGRTIVASDIPEHRRVAAECGCLRIVPHEAGAYASAVLEALHASGPGSAGEEARSWVLAHRTYELLASRLDQVISAVTDRRWEKGPTR